MYKLLIQRTHISKLADAKVRKQPLVMLLCLIVTIKCFLNTLAERMAHKAVMRGVKTIA